MNKAILKTIVLDQQKVLAVKEKDYVPRDLEKKITESKKNNFIVIIAGVRRCGKSTLLNYWRQKQKDQDYYFSFDDERLVNFTVADFQNLVEIFLELYGRQNVFYFDEIQNISGWERFARRLHNEGKKVYITGSNASLLSRELGTHLTGRYLEYSLFPFSFSEFLSFKQVKTKKHFTTEEKVEFLKHFKQYLKSGGFPEYLKTKNQEVLKTLYRDILYRDIIVRYNLPQERPLRELVSFCASNIGKEISFNSLKTLVGVKSSTTIKEYFDYLENSFLVFLVPKYDFSYKKQLVANKKVYFIDNGLAKQIGFRFSPDKGRFLENLVFIALKRQGKEIFYHQAKFECDFLIKEGQKIKQVIQVAYLLDRHNRQREINGLLEAMKTYNLKKGIILTMEQAEEFNLAGRKIKIMPVWQWLLAEAR